VLLLGLDYVGGVNAHLSLLAFDVGCHSGGVQHHEVVDRILSYDVRHVLLRLWLLTTVGLLLACAAVRLLLGGGCGFWVQAGL
jgi:hypothetical protein